MRCSPDPAATFACLGCGMSRGPRPADVRRQPTAPTCECHAWGCRSARQHRQRHSHVRGAPLREPGTAPAPRAPRPGRVRTAAAWTRRVFQWPCRRPWGPVPDSRRCTVIWLLGAVPAGAAGDQDPRHQRHPVQPEDHRVVAGVAPPAAVQADARARVVVPPAVLRRRRRSARLPGPPAGPATGPRPRAGATAASEAAKLPSARTGRTEAAQVSRRRGTANDRTKVRTSPCAQPSVSSTAVTWKLLRTTTCRARGNCRATRAPSAGVVIESSSPLSTSTGTAG